MSATDVAAKVRASALAAVDKNCFGEDFGVDAMVSMAQTPTGGLMVLYTLVLSMRSPLLGSGPLVNVTQIASPNPSAEQVEQAALQGMKSLRDHASEILNGGNAAAVQPG